MNKEFEALAESFAEIIYNSTKPKQNLKELRERREAVQKALEYAKINDVNYHLESENNV